MRRVACLTAALVLTAAAPWVHGQSGDLIGLLQQRLNGQFALTRITSDRSDMVSAGAVLTLQKDGLLMYSTASPMPPVNNYKNGKISQGGGGFGRDLLITMAAPGGATATDYPHRSFVAGEKVWAIGLTIQKKATAVTGVVFRLYSDPYDGIRYYGELNFPFEKGTVSAPDQALAKIAEVLVVQPADNTSVAAAPQLQSIAGTYVMTQAPDNWLALNANGTLVLRQKGRTYSGDFTINGNKLTLRVGTSRTRSTSILQGDTMTDPGGSAWVKQKAALDVVAEPQLEQVTGLYVRPQATDDRLQLNTDGTFSASQAGRDFSGTFIIANGKLIMRWGGRVATCALQGDTIIDDEKLTWVKQKPGTPQGGQPLRLPSTYVSAQAPADQLQLNADNTFSLLEGGQNYQGTFAVSGNTLDINLSDGTKNAVTIQGNNLTDSSGQTWVLREQPSQVASSAAVLQNQDIIKMVKAGLDEAIILAKISGSKCQFDTSTDALIQLKGSGVSAAVLKAMVGAGK